MEDRNVFKKYIDKDTVIQFLKFGSVGAINSILNIVIYWICIKAGMHYLLANGIGFLITVAISYILNNLFTFTCRDKSPEWSLINLLKVYASYFLTGIVINSILLWLWNDLIGINENISPVLNLLITVPLNFIINKFWAYQEHNSNIETNKDSLF